MKLRHSKSGFVGLAALVAFAVLPSVAVADDHDTCTTKSGDLAIAACDRAIASGRYQGTELGVLYVSRAFEQGAKENLDLAIADYGQAIQINPTYSALYLNRGYLWQAKGKLDFAIADYNEAIRLDGNNMGAYYDRGRAHFYAGALPKALADFSYVSERRPDFAYAALWLDIVSKRKNVPSQLGEAIKHIDMTKWPAPILRLYLGQLTPQAVLAAADDPDLKTKRERLCAANFYSGKFVLTQGKIDEAKRLFNLAVRDCPKQSIDYQASTAELQALTANR